jgi:hypothetical protein
MLGYDINPVTGALRLPSPWGRMVSPGGVAPSLVIDAGRGVYGRSVGGRLQRIDLAGAVSFARAGTAMTIGPNGIVHSVAADLARITHDPMTGARLGLLLEESRTNQLLHAEDWMQTGWNIAFFAGSRSNEAVPGGTPTGGATATRFVEDGATAGRSVLQNTSFVSGTQYVLSCFVRRGVGERHLRLLLPSAAFGANLVGSCNLDTGAVTLSGAGTNFTGGLAAQLINGWWRFWITAQATTTTTSGANFGFLESPTSTGTNYAGDGVSSLFLWGAQVGPGARPTSYIPTGPAAVTRAADSAAVPGAAWLASDQGTLVVEVVTPLPPGELAVANVDAGSRDTNPYIRVQLRSIGGARVFWNPGGGATTINTAVLDPWPGRVRVAVRWNGTAMSCCLNGGTIASGTGTGAFSGLNRLLLGQGAFLTAPDARNIVIARAVHFPTALSDADMQAVATP